MATHFVRTYEVAAVFTMQSRSTRRKDVLRRCGATVASDLCPMIALASRCHSSFCLVYPIHMLRVTGRDG
jgi:hypothetical protein